MSDYKELARRLRREMPVNVQDAADAIEDLSAEVERWRDPDSDERQKIQEEIILSLGDGARSEVELREGQLDVTEAALAHARADLERVRAERNRFLTAMASATIEADKLKQELAEATASRDRLQQVVEAFGDGGEKGPSVWAFIDEWPTLKEKAKALDELEAWLRETAPRYTEVAFSFACGFQVIPAGTAANGRLGETLVAAIRAALEKARGA